MTESTSAQQRWYLSSSTKPPSTVRQLKVTKIDHTAADIPVQELIALTGALQTVFSNAHSALANKALFPLNAASALAQSKLVVYAAHGVVLRPYLLQKQPSQPSGRYNNVINCAGTHDQRQHGWSLQQSLC